MIKVQLLHAAVVTAQSGSILIISEGQYKALGDKAVIVNETARNEEPEEPEQSQQETPAEPEPVQQKTPEEPDEARPKTKRNTKKK